MLNALRIFKDQKKQNRHKGLVRSPYTYFFRWRKSLVNKSSSVQDELPWLTFESIDYLASHLDKKDSVFEYGGGGSTLFFLNLVSAVVTVEHNKGWFSILSEKIKEKNSNSWQGRFIEAQQGDLISPADKSDPAHYSSGDKASTGMHYKDYASFIDTFPDEHFSCVVVDGRSRPACMIHSIPKIKRNGLLVLDNSDRSWYLEKTEKILSGHFEKVIDSVGPSPYSRAFTKTTIWKKVK